MHFSMVSELVVVHIMMYNMMPTIQLPCHLEAVRGYGFNNSHDVLEDVSLAS